MLCARWLVVCVAMVMASVVKATLVDLSHEHGFNTIMAPRNPKYTRDMIFDGELQPGVHAKFGSYSVGEHGGTHIDSPVHFSKEGYGMEEIPLESTIADGIMIDCTEETAKDEMYALTLDKVKEWEKMNGEIPKGAAVVINFNWSHRFNDSQKYFNPKQVGEKESFRFPHVGQEACDFLVDERDISILAIDTAGPDMLKGTFHVHVKMLTRNKLIVENINGAGRLPPTGFRFHATPVKFVGATGVQVRAFAVVHEPGNGARTLGGGGFSACVLVVIALVVARGINKVFAPA